MTERTELEQLALAKLERVLGPEVGARLLDETLRKHDFRVHTAADLKRLGSLLRDAGGYAGAVGSMLGVQAVILDTQKR